jgi:hypothetical protein
LASLWWVTFRFSLNYARVIDAGQMNIAHIEDSFRTAMFR